MRLYPGSARRHTQVRRLIFVCALFLAQGLSPVCPFPVFAQTQKTAEPANQSQEELARRLKAAADARDSHDQAAVTRANERLIALVFRELAHLHLAASDDAQAISLYSNSLNYEDLSDTRLDLAIAEVEANRIDDAIKDVQRACAVDAARRSRQ